MDGEPGVGSDPTESDVLTFEECMSLLRDHRVGRVALSVSALPTVVVVDYAVADGALLIRTDHASSLVTATTESVVAFEVDEVDAATGRGRSVVVRGVAREVQAQEVRRMTSGTCGLPTGGDHRLVCVPVELLTGRRLRMLPGGSEGDGADRRWRER